MKRFWAIFKKEFRQIGRDPLSLGLLIFIPALLLVLYGYALSFDVKHIRVAAADYDRTPESRDFLDGLFENPYFDRAGALGSSTEADAVLDRGRARAVLVIPRGYAADLARGGAADVQALVDGADATTAATTIGYLDALAERAALEAQADLRATPAARPAVIAVPRVWFNPELESAKFLVPGLIALLLMLSAVVATSLSIVRERERETMEQMMVSPLRPEELVLGKTLPYVLICLATMAMVLLLGYVLFGVAIRGSFLLLGLATLLFLFAALGMGVLISAVTRSQQVAFQVAVIASLLPSIILSGFIFPIRNMPLPIQGVTLILAPRYFVSALRKIILKGAPFQAVWMDLLAMLLLGVAFNLLAAHKTRKALWS
ncbi:MAG TPA: ABC transporter permease [Kiritimatiellia bacterium]|nr:ABC transporter permease [Kiritimatiellia bacterium]HRZ12318.1 ABC transporter permease [Kiritimatiellia bacterium]HSA17924.1 ABC transporter permease [Kiritimatiellia bacterium]